MEFTVVKSKKSIEIFIDDKKVKFKDDFCFILGNIYNLDEIEKFPKKYTIEQKILKLYHKHGNELFKILNGEYFIVFIIKNTIIMVRDRMGTKQLYYTIINDTFICSSSLKYLIKNYKNKLQINKQVVADYLCYCYIQEPNTIFKDVYKLEAGNYLIYKNNRINNTKYYDLVEDYLKNKNRINKKEKAEKELEYALRKSIEVRMNDKNRIGIFFSAGVDSTLLASISKEFPDKEISTYTIGFYEEERNEAVDAKKIAKYLKTNHREFYLEQDKAMELIKKIPKIYSEPFADPSIVPMMFLYDNINKEQEIFFTGDGADQLFVGSNVYDNFVLPQSPYLRIKRVIKQLILKHEDKNIPPQKYLYMNKKNTTKLFMDIEPKSYYDIKNIKQKMQIMYMLFDLKSFLANRLFTKMSFQSIYHNITVVHPFVDNKVVNKAFQINHKYKYFKKNKKYILKKILYKKIPKELLSNKKNGFGIPLKNWLYNIYLEDIIKYSEPSILEKQGIFPVEKIIIQINKLKNQELNNEESYVMFAYYMFQLWYNEYIDNLLGNN